MRKMVIGLVVLWASIARAGVLADGSYEMTGNAAVDVGLTVVNALNKEIAVKHEFQKFYVDSGKIDKAMEARMDELRAAKTKLAEERKKQLDAREDLRKGAADRKREAGGDAKKEAELEKAAKARETELKSAADDIDKADKALADSIKLGDQFRAVVGKIRGKDEKQALADWNGGLRNQLEKLQTKIRDKAKAAGDAVAKAGALIQKDSGLTTKTEAVGAFTAEVGSLSGAKQTELYINGKKVKVGDKVAVGKDDKLELRAMIVPPRREQARKYKQELAGGKTSTAQVVISAADEYTLSYSLGTKKSDWKVTDEKYEWKAPETRTGANLDKATTSSGKIAKDDVYTITFPAGTASETIRGYVYGSIVWTNASTKEDASEGLSYELKIYPSR